MTWSWESFSVGLFVGMSLILLMLFGALFAAVVA